jgi:hypothetical protein
LKLDGIPITFRGRHSPIYLLSA